jgi:hypothetical protein
MRCDNSRELSGSDKYADAYWAKQRNKIAIETSES